MHLSLPYCELGDIDMNYKILYKIQYLITIHINGASSLTASSSRTTAYRRGSPIYLPQKAETEIKPEKDQQAPP